MHKNQSKCDNRTITRLLKGIFICGTVASFAPEHSEGANDATRVANKQYDQQKLFYSYYHHHVKFLKTSQMSTLKFGHKILFQKLKIWKLSRHEKLVRFWMVFSSDIWLVENDHISPCWPISKSADVIWFAAAKIHFHPQSAHNWLIN